MSDLKTALRFVDTRALAPLMRIEAAMPKDSFGDAKATWFRRRAEIENDVIAELRTIGGSVSDGDPVRVRIAGVTGSSTMGLTQALRHWRHAALAQLQAQKQTRGGARG